MKIYTFLFLSVILINVSSSADAQNKNAKKTNSKTQKQSVNKPGNENVRVDTSGMDTPPEQVQLENTRIDPGPAPQIDFDTTAAPADEFTKDIIRLLAIIKVEENDVKMAELTLSQSLGSDTSAVNKLFYTRFINELKSGQARKWLTNLYVKAYRSTFSPDDVKSLIQFYQTPLGEKLIGKLPMLMQQVMTESQSMGRYLGAKLMGEIIDEQKRN